MKSIIIIIIAFLVNIPIYSQSYYTYVDSADACIQRKDWIKAESNILNALRAEPANYNNSLLLSNLATIQRMQGRSKEAINNYSLALNMTPNAVTLLDNRGTLYFEMDSTELALNDFVKAMELDKKDQISRYYYSIIKMEHQDLTESKRVIDELKKINSKSTDYKDALARWNQLSSNYDDAISLYSELLKIEVRNEWLIHRAECSIAKHSLLSASDDINDALKVDPTNGYLYLLKSKLNKMQFQNEDSFKNLELAVKHGIDRKYAEKYVSEE